MARVLVLRSPSITRANFVCNPLTAGNLRSYTFFVLEEFLFFASELGDIKIARNEKY